MAISRSTPTTGPERIPVAVGIVQNAAGELLIQQRLPDRPCAGQWEFPGGKIECGESPEEALIRELAEELGIVVSGLSPLMRHCHDYPHGGVLLHVFRVQGFRGRVQGREGQNIEWKSATGIRRMDALAAVYPILSALDDQCSG